MKMLLLTSLTSIIGTSFNPNFADFAGIFLECCNKFLKYLVM